MEHFLSSAGRRVYLGTKFKSLSKIGAQCMKVTYVGTDIVPDDEDLISVEWVSSARTQNSYFDFDAGVDLSTTGSA